ncbi:MAG: hypothetical protein HYS38_07140 [Acidobacteria bacterium]|nr:hypothetical protein [Acidobacteriota bacterium]
MRTLRFLLASLLLCGVPWIASADVLMLKNGQAITGTFQGGDQSSVTFIVNRQTRKYQLSDVNSITFTSADDQGQTSSTPTAAPSSASGRSTSSTTAATSTSSSTATRTSITVPVATELVVRMIDPVDSSMHKTGQTFRASLDEPLVVNGRTIAPRGAEVTAKMTEVEQAGRMAGRSELTLVLLDITIDGRKREITTSSVSEAGASRGSQTAKRVGGLAAAGAVIGAIAGGGKGAAQGAAAGAGAGATIQVLTKGEKVQIPAESRLVFTLKNSLYL